MPLRKHALMKNAAYQNAPSILAVEDNVPAMLHAAQARANMFTSPPEFRISGELPATRFQIVDVTDGLVRAPTAEGIGADLQQVGFGTLREAERCHGLARRAWKLECFADP